MSAFNTVNITGAADARTLSGCLGYSESCPKPLRKSVLFLRMIQKSVFKYNTEKLKIAALLQTVDDELSLAQEEL